MFFDLFNPNNRHRTEELRRLENTREEEAQGVPGRGPIDLNSGTVLIRVPTNEPAASDEESAEDGTEEPEGAVDEGAAASTKEDGGA